MPCFISPLRTKQTFTWQVQGWWAPCKHPSSSIHNKVGVVRETTKEDFYSTKQCYKSQCSFPGFIESRLAAEKHVFEKQMRCWYSCSLWEQAKAIHHYHTSHSWCGLHPSHSQSKRCIILVLLSIFLVSKIPILETITCVLMRQLTLSTINRNSELRIIYYTTSVRTLFTCDVILLHSFRIYLKKKTKPSNLVSFSLPLQPIYLSSRTE